MDIVETKKFGIANTIDGKIYLHPILREFPSLREKIIRHEGEHLHIKEKGIKGFLKQRKTDMLTKLSFSDLLPVYKKKPFLFFLQYSPITYKDKTIFIEWSLIFLYTIYILIGASIFWLIRLFSTDSIFFWKVIKYMVITLGISVVLYFIGKRLRNYINEESEKVTKKVSN